MIELVCGIISVVACVVGAYGFAVAKARREQVDNLKEQLSVLRADLKEWQSKALLRHGSTPLGQKPYVHNKDKPEIIATPRIPTRQELQMREFTAQPQETRKVQKPVINRDSTYKRAVEEAGAILTNK